MSELKSFTQGFFEILLPGSFLLLNVAAFLCVAVGVSPVSHMMPGTEKWGIVEAVPALGASYILGMVLRMLRTEIPDRVSAWCLGHIPPRLQEADLLKESFFYVKWMRERHVPCLPSAAKDFFEGIWAKHYQQPIPGVRNPNTDFFNFMKTLFLAIDKNTSEQLMASEAISRFVASSFWALAICTGLLAVDGGVLYFRGLSLGVHFCVWLFIIYLTVLYGIVRHFRYLRCKEVALVFEVSFAYRNEIEKRLKAP